MQIELINTQRVIKMFEEEMKEISTRLAHSSTEAAVRDLERDIIMNMIEDIRDLDPNLILDENENILFLNEPDFERGKCYECEISHMDDECNLYCVLGDSYDECPIHKVSELVEYGDSYYEN